MVLAQTPPATATDLLEACMAVVRRALPPTWNVQSMALDSTDRSDSAIRITAPDATSVNMIVEIRRLVERRDVPRIMEQLIKGAKRTEAFPLLMSQYLSTSVREAIAERGGSYADATGNVRLELDRPTVFVSSHGADKNPWRNQLGRPRGTLRGTPASRVVRALVDIERAWRVSDLIAESEGSTGATYRVLDYLLEEGLVEKVTAGGYVVPRWRALVEAWSRDYSFQGSNNVASYIDPRGVANFVATISGSKDFDWAATGSVAAEEWQPYAPIKAAMVYVDNLTHAAGKWGLRAAETGGNVILAEPESNVVFRRTVLSAKGLRLASPAQVAVDLLNGPGRNPSEAVELLNWMERNESVWRR